MVHRDWRVAKNGRWYLVDADGLRRIGWGDVSFEDLAEVHVDLGVSVFVVVREDPVGARLSGSPWRWYDQPDATPGPTLEEVCRSALLAVLAEGGPLAIDPFDICTPGEVVDLGGGMTLPCLPARQLLQMCRELVESPQRAQTTASPSPAVFEHTEAG